MLTMVVVSFFLLISIALAQIEPRYNVISDAQYEALKAFLLGSKGEFRQAWGNSDPIYVNFNRCSDPTLTSLHTGVDYSADIGTPVFSATKGRVIRVNQGKDCQRAGCLSTLAIYNSESKTSFIYLHMDTIIVNVGQQVRAGQQVGTVGRRGFATGPHLHFEVRPGYSGYGALCISDTVNPYQAVMDARGPQPIQCPTISVNIQEHIIRPVPDPAAETAVTQKLIENGFRAVREEYLTSKADIAIEGEAFAEGVGRFSGFQQAKARLEVKVINTSTGELLASEALHAGGIDVNLDLAAKRAFQRAGEKMGERLAPILAQKLNCGSPQPPDHISKQVGVNSFESKVSIPNWDERRGMKEMVERALSKRGIKVAVPVAADVIVSGTITDYKVVYQEIGIPILNLILRAGVAYMTVEPRAFDLETAEMVRGDEIRDFASGFEILGFSFGFGPKAVAKKISNRIVDWVKSRILLR